MNYVSINYKSNCKLKHVIVLLKYFKISENFNFDILLTLFMIIEISC